MDFSIVIPTWNRSELVESLLKSLHAECKRYQQGKTEVLIVDSSTGNEKESIMRACKAYDANYIEGNDSVRKKRNKGIVLSKYDTILFIDSDVTVEKGLLDEYVEAYKNPYGVKLGGVLGYTEFVGKKTFWWKILERTSFVNSFSFARKYPFHSWTIGNNVSFKKAVLEEIGMFEENFPFKLGGDDLDMTYRVTKAGYMIGSAPNAVTYHSRKTWNNYKAVHDRAKRWGTMENYIVERHPELYKRIIPKDYIIILIVLIAMLIVSLITWNWLPLITAAVWVVINGIIDYFVEISRNGYCAPFYFYCAQIIQLQYELYRVLGSIKKRSFSALYKGMIFNRYQIKYGMADEAFRIKKMLFSFLSVLILTIVYSQLLIK